MSSINNEIVIRTSEYRPCFVGEHKALFHRWEDYGDKFKRTIAIVEFEDGTVDTVNPRLVRFVDGKINEYSFE